MKTADSPGVSDTSTSGAIIHAMPLFDEETHRGLRARDRV